MGRESSPEENNATQKNEISRRALLKGSGALLASQALGGTASAAETIEVLGSPFDERVQRRTLISVLELMHISVDIAAMGPAPQVVHAEDLSDEEFRKMIGFNAGTVRSNLFAPPRTIVLTAGAKVHNLAHELAHYAQYTYQKLMPDGVVDDFLEQAAVEIQDHFRE